jgi:hypothetical protein
MLRTYRINFRKNWVIQPSVWNKFFTNLELDLIDLKAEFDAQIFSATTFHTASEDIITDGGKDNRIKHPNL